MFFRIWYLENCICLFKQFYICDFFIASAKSYSFNQSLKKNGSCGCGWRFLCNMLRKCFIKA